MRSIYKFLIVGALACITAICFSLWQERQRGAQSGKQAETTQSIKEQVFRTSPEWNKAWDAFLTATKAEVSRIGGKKTELPDWRNVLELAKVLVDKYPDNTDSWWLLGDVYEKLDLPGDAVAAYQQQLTLAKQQNADTDDISRIWAGLGPLYEKLGQTTQAQFAFSQAIPYQRKVIDQYSADQSKPPNLKPEELSKWQKDVASVRAQGLETLADYYAGAGFIERAKQSYLQAIRENPYKHSPYQEAIIDALAKLCAKNDDEMSAFTSVYDGMVLDQRENPERDAWEVLSWAMTKQESMKHLTGALIKH